jgi:hypothetical protein
MSHVTSGDTDPLRSGAVGKGQQEGKYGDTYRQRENLRRNIVLHKEYRDMDLTAPGEAQNPMGLVKTISSSLVEESGDTS